MKIRIWAWWHKPVNPCTQEAKEGGQWGLCLKNPKNKKKKST
jgi:hypothetical protein